MKESTSKIVSFIIGLGVGIVTTCTTAIIVSKIKKRKPENKGGVSFNKPPMPKRSVYVVFKTVNSAILNPENPYNYITAGFINDESHLVEFPYSSTMTMDNYTVFNSDQSNDATELALLEWMRQCKIDESKYTDAYFSKKYDDPSASERPIVSTFIGAISKGRSTVCFYDVFSQKLYKDVPITKDPETDMYVLKDMPIVVSAASAEISAYVQKHTRAAMY